MTPVNKKEVGVVEVLEKLREELVGGLTAIFRRTAGIGRSPSDSPAKNVQGIGRAGESRYKFGRHEFTASSRACLNEVSPTARVLTSGKDSRPSSLRTWPGGISRNSRQPNSVRTVVASCQRTPCAMLLAKSSEIACALRKALPVTLPM